MNKVDRFRIGLLSVLGVIIVVVIGYGTLYALNLAPGIGTTAGPDFRTLDRPLQTDPIEVVEFFSYACPHCDNLEPMLASWVEDLPENVQFRRVHVAIDTMTTRLAKTHLVLESQDLIEGIHRRVFEAIHDRNITFVNDEQMAEFMHRRGIESDRFLSIFNGRHIERRLKANQDLVADTRNLGVPALFIGNKFLVTSRGGNRQLLDTGQWLVEELIEGRDPTPIEKVEESAEATASEEANAEEASDSESATESVEDENSNTD